MVFLSLSPTLYQHKKYKHLRKSRKFCLRVALEPTPWGAVTWHFFIVVWGQLEHHRCSISQPLAETSLHGNGKIVSVTEVCLDLRNKTCCVTAPLAANYVSIWHEVFLGGNKVCAKFSDLWPCPILLSLKVTCLGSSCLSRWLKISVKVFAQMPSLLMTIFAVRVSW